MRALCKRLVYVVNGVASGSLNVFERVPFYSVRPHYKALHWRIGTNVNHRAKNGQIGLSVFVFGANKYGRLYARNAVDEVEPEAFFHVLNIG